MLIMAGAGPSAPALRALGDSTQAGLFDYFASEIFEKTDGATQDLLLATSFLQRIEPGDAELLTGNPMAGQLLERLSRSHYFTQKYDRAYQYHPLFREFLQNRARAALSPENIVFMRRNAAALLEESGRTEEAVAISIEACDWSRAERLLLCRASTLVSQGRSKIIKEWISRIPPEIAANAPWLLYWLGVCHIHYSPAEAKKHFENAYIRFGERGDMEGLFLSWAGIVEALVYGLGDFKPLDSWIAWLHETCSRGMPCLPPEIDAKVAADMFMAMVYRQPYHPDIGFWRERSLALAEESCDANLLLQAYSTAANYYFWIGDLEGIVRIGSKIGELDRSPEASPFHKIVWRFIDAANDLCFAPSAASAIPKLNEAIRIADETGVHIWDHMLFALGVYSSNLQGNFVEADAFLKRMKPLLSNARLHQNCQYHGMNAWLAVLRGDCHHALVNAEAALKLAQETGFLFPEIICLLELANILQTDGRHEEAGSYLEEAIGLALKTRSPLFQFAGLLSKARVDLEKGGERDGLRILSDAMQIGKNKGYLGPPWWWQPSVMAALCARALEHGIETDYVRKLIRCRSLVPAENMTGLDNWPYPVKIYTLGKFAILTDDEPAESALKATQKPLMLLKALVALGGSGVPEIRISDILWSDADGDSAHKSFEMTLLRLRRLLDSDEVISLRGGAISLDSRRCWVDAQAFENLARNAEEAWKKSSGRESRDWAAEAVRLSEKALEMYRGPFLPNDTDMDCTVAMREKMRNLALQLVASLGSRWETLKQWEKSIEYYRRGVDIDQLSEEFYRRLMVCHDHLGQKADAVRAYERCRTVLSSTLGIEPSEKTQEVYNRIRRIR